MSRSDGARAPLHFTTRAAWRAWLAAHHDGAREAWLVIARARHRDTGLTLDDAVEEALCFGWIDGKLQPVDDEKYALRFSPRRPSSVWSVRNIARVEALTRRGLMTEKGLDVAERARRAGHFDAARAREDTETIPDELARALRRRRGALAGYRGLSASRRKQLLFWLASAKRAETRQKRIDAIVAEASR